MLESPTDTHAAKKALARTYNNPSYPDPWQAVQDYERVQQAAADHPEKGSSALSRVVNLPRGRIRGWVDGEVMPDAYRGLQTALDHGWILDDWDAPTAEALIVLSAWIVASGSINQEWTPRFVADTDREIETLRTAIQQAGLAVTTVHGRGDGRPVEWEPRRDARVLGRVLYTWTGVRGDKTQAATRFPSFPAYAPTWVARVFAQTYVSLRGSPRPDTSETRVQVAVDRDRAFYEALTDLLRRVVEDESEIRGTTLPLHLTGDAARELRELPRLDE